MDNELLKQFEDALHRAQMSSDKAEKDGDAVAARNHVEAARQIAGEMRKLLRAEHPEAMTLPSPTEEGARLAAEDVEGRTSKVSIKPYLPFPARLGAMATGKEPEISTDIPEQYMIAAGRGALDKPAMGLKQAFLSGISMLDIPISGPAGEDLAESKKQEAEKDVAYNALQRQFPIATAVGEAAPYAAVPGSAGVVGGAALIGGMEALKPGSRDERLRRGGIGAVTALSGGIAGNALGRTLAPVTRESISRAKSQAIRIAEKIGYELRLSEATGSRFLGRLEDMSAKTTGGMGIMENFSRQNAHALNKHAAKSIGENAVELSDEVFASATARIKGVFNSVDKLGKVIRIPKSASSVADDVIKSTRKMRPSDVDPNLVNDALQLQKYAATNAKLDASAYQSIRSGLSNASFDAVGESKVLYGKLLRALDKYADDALKMTGNARLGNELKLARKQWGNLQVLQKGLAVEGGNVSAKRVATVLRAQNPSKFKTGAMKDNPLYDVAQLGENMDFLAKGSQTYERQAVMGPSAIYEKGPWAYSNANLGTSQLMSAYPRLLSSNPRLARMLIPAGDAATAATRAGILASDPLEQYR